MGLVRGRLSKLKPVVRPDPIWKDWKRVLFPRITMVSVFRICTFMRAPSLWGKT
jgi:hypothetical protein